jgi:hypothetical protein
MAPCWIAFRKVYPRVVTGMVLGIAVLLLTHLVLTYERGHGRELARARASMPEAERPRVDAMAAPEEKRPAAAAELSRRQAPDDTDLHLERRVRARVADGSNHWAAPEWVYVDRGSLAPGDGRAPGASAPLAIFLDSEAALFSRPAPFGDVSYVLPGSVRTEAPGPWWAVLEPAAPTGPSATWTRGAGGPAGGGAGAGEARRQPSR